MRGRSGDRSGGSSVDDGRRRRWRLRWSRCASQGLERRGERRWGSEIWPIPRMLEKKGERDAPPIKLLAVVDVVARAPRRPERVQRRWVRFFGAVRQ
ncbi:hypothetical protein DEO72_LG7g491 [Vigna unguiculata]|uniref:Uncharacterized protein n=1 Tax=Vigna unguiculata TaxID=3917 RepID=A0A4D6MEQ5_VIGUN|nr:hypothetical protein DEO72_LG7g491 [Vigna unguiculata]